MLDDLGDRHHQLCRRGLLADQGAEVHRFGLYHVQGGIDFAEQRAATRWIFRRIGKSQALPHDVVDLRRIQPCVRVRERHAVRDQAGTRDRQRQFLVIFRLGDRRSEQRQEWGGRGHRDVPRADQHLGERGNLHRFRLVGTQLDLAVYRFARLGQPRGYGIGAGKYADLGMEADELEALHLQPQAHRVPPADIGAAVGVVADPGGEHDRFGGEFGPAVGPGAACYGDQSGVEPIDGIAAVLDRGDRLFELAAQGDRRGAVGFEGRRRPAAGQFGQRLVDWQRE